MDKTLFKIIKNSALICLLGIFLFTLSYLFSQENTQSNEPRKNEQSKELLQSFKGKWAGFLSSDSTGKIIIGMNISVIEDSIFGNSSIQWPTKVATQIFKGKFDKRNKSLTLFEPQEDKKAGVYQCVIKNENNKLTLTGTWTRNRDGRQFSCELDRVGNLTYATQNPIDIIKNLIGNIDEYSQTREDDYLRKVYSMWLSPEVRIGEFDNFKQGFSTTMNDKIIPINDYIKSKYGLSYTNNPHKLAEVDGISSFITVIHEAQEYLTDGDVIKLQRSVYQGDYKLIVTNGVWKILSGKAKLLDRQVEDKTFTSSDFRNKFNITEISSILEITGIFPNPANENDTVTVNFVQNSADEIQDIKIFFDKTEAKIVGERVLGQIKCIVPGGLNNENPVVIIRTLKSEGPPYMDFKFKAPWYLRIQWYIFVLLIVLIIGIIIYAKRRNDKLAKETQKLSEETQKLTQEKEQITTNISQFLETKDANIIPFPDPEVPEELIEACKKCNCVLFTSSELSAMGGYPNAEDFVLSLINWSVKNKHLTIEQSDLLVSSVKSGRYENAIENTIANLQSKNIDISEYIKNIYSKPASKQPDIFKYIKDTSFSFFVTSNYDNLIENSFTEPLQVFTSKDTDKLRIAFTSKTPFVFKIYGRTEEPDSLLLTPSQFSDAVYQNLQLSQFIENVFYSRMVFCAGADIDAIERFMNNINIRSSNQQKHFALVGVKGADWETRASILKRRYGIEIIPYTHGDISQMENFMKTLSERAPAALYVNKEHKGSQHSPIRKLILENIGPFEKLELDLDKNWNILLGDNGVGKSTILKAIAIGLCGEYAAPYANRLININSKTKSGTVTIITDTAKYVTTIHDDDTRAKISTNAPAIKFGGALKIGFPPLRTITWENSGETYAGQSHPINEDILPIITGEIDPRMDKLKRWLIDLKGNSTGLDKDDTRPQNKYAALILKFFDIVRELTPGMDIQYCKIDTVKKKVYIKTYDTEIPIESISQGTLSLTSWVGILLQRLYEIHGDKESDPTKMYALVLMDEIDAHMHPDWQRRIVYNLKKVFPNIQFIVSTHSPLVVSGMPVNQLLRFKRDTDGKVIKVEIDETDTMGRVNQILTNKLFDLSTPIDYEAELSIDEYKTLLGNPDRTEEEENKLQALKKLVEKRTPYSGTSEDRKKEMELDKTLKEKLLDKFKK
jgi:predicted ATP-binding protein involved in virulence